MREKVEKAILLYYKDMYRLAYSYVKNTATAEDIVQDSVISAMNNASKIRDFEKVKSYLLAIVVHKALDFLKKENNITSLDDSPEALNIGLSDKYEDIDLKNALEILSPIEKTVIVLRFFEDLPLKEIAAALGKNENTVKSILYRSFEKLKKLLSSNEKEGA